MSPEVSRAWCDAGDGGVDVGDGLACRPARLQAAPAKAQPPSRADAIGPAGVVAAYICLARTDESLPERTNDVPAMRDCGTHFWEETTCTNT
jgi:hypothetical protein